MTVALTEPPTESTMPDESKFKALLTEQLKDAQHRTMFNGTEVRDILLDLWNALDADHAPPVPEPELTPTG